MITLLVPTIGLVAVVALFAAWAIIGGVTALIGAWRTRGQRHWWVGIVEGLVGLAAGVVAIFWPLQITAIALLYVVAAWAIVTGLLQIWLAIRMREQIRGELLLGIAGLVSVAFGLVLVINPGAVLLSVLWLVGVSPCHRGNARPPWPAVAAHLHAGKTAERILWRAGYLTHSCASIGGDEN